MRYQWLRNGGVVGGATANTYVLGDADVGTQISVRVTYTDGQGTVEGPLTSVQTAAVANVNDTPVGVPTITGTVTEDQTLTADVSGISDADGLRRELAGVAPDCCREDGRVPGSDLLKRAADQCRILGTHQHRKLNREIVCGMDTLLAQRTLGARHQPQEHIRD